MRFFSTGQLTNVGHERNEIWHEGSLGDEDDARTSNTRIAQRKHVIPHLTMKNMMFATLDNEEYDVLHTR